MLGITGLALNVINGKVKFPCAVQNDCANKRPHYDLWSVIELLSVKNKFIV